MIWLKNLGKEETKGLKKRKFISKSVKIIS